MHPLLTDPTRFKWDIYASGWYDTEVVLTDLATGIRSTAAGRGPIEELRRRAWAQWEEVSGNHHTV